MMMIVPWASRKRFLFESTVSRAAAMNRQREPSPKIRHSAPNPFLSVATPMLDTVHVQRLYCRPRSGKYLMNSTERGISRKPVYAKKRFTAACGLGSIKTEQPCDEQAKRENGNSRRH